MKAIEGHRFLSTTRTPLQDVIPLDTPYLLFIDPSSACNFSCSFCACGLANKHNWSENKTTGVMRYELYRNIIDQCCDFPKKIKTLRLYKEGEPLINKRLPDMISYAKNKNMTNNIDFTTNASLLTPDLSLAIIDAGLDRVNISVEGLDEASYQNNAGAKINFSNFVANIEYLYEHRGKCHVFIKISDFGLGEYAKEDFYKLFGDICDEISVESVTPVWPNHNVDNIKENFNSGIYGNDIRKVDVCPYIFYSICVNSDGTVSACLMDWNHKLIVGDTRNSSIVDIWNADIIQKMRIMNLKKHRNDISTCAECGQLVYASIDNIDKYREQLLEKCGV